MNDRAKKRMEIDNYMMEHFPKILGILRSVSCESGFNILEVRKYRKAIRELIAEHRVKPNKALYLINVDSIAAAFTWYATKQGYDFWLTLAIRIIEVKEEQRKKQEKEAYKATI